MLNQNSNFAENEMNDRARKMWRENAELLHEKHVETLQSAWILGMHDNSWTMRAKIDTLTNRLSVQFLNVEKLLGEQLSDWTVPKMDLSRFIPLLPAEDRKTVTTMIKNAYNNVGDCNGIVEAELDYKDAIRIMEEHETIQNA
jgi:hypothetical protein